MKVYDKDYKGGLKAFEDCFHCMPEQRWFSPGRVNLIGEHTDYNRGWVLPAATDLGTILDVGRNSERQINVISLAKGQSRVVPLLDAHHLRPQANWTDYIAGVARALWPSAEKTIGLNIVIDSDLPLGSGLSSSASLLVAMVNVFNEIWNCGVEADRIPQLAKQVENEFVGVECGILDPFAVARGKAGYAIALNCDDMTWQYVALIDNRYKIVVANTGVARVLRDTPYNQRRHESRSALDIAIRKSGADSPNDLTIEDLDCLSHINDDGVAYRRAKHVVSENARVQQAIEALTTRDLVVFGRLMSQSHESLRDDYEVSCAELDLMVDLFTEQRACVGAKMTGAGFGGAVVAVVATDGISDFIPDMLADYNRRTGLEASFSVCNASAGTHRLLD